MRTKTRLALQSAAHHLMSAMEIINGISEKEYIQVVKIAKEQKAAIKNISFSAELGNPFMTIFRVREWLEELSLVK